MAGYPGTPQARKLGLKPGQRVALDEPPDGWRLREPPDGLQAPGPDGAADLIVAFFRAAAEIPGRLPALARRVFPAGAIWAAWPRRAGGHDSDITDNVVRGHAGRILRSSVPAATRDDFCFISLWRYAGRLLRHQSPAPRPGGGSGTFHTLCPLSCPLYPYLSSQRVCKVNR